MNLTAIFCTFAGLLAGGFAGWWLRGHGIADLWAKVKPAGGAVSNVLDWGVKLAGVVALCLMIAPNFKGCDWTPGPNPDPVVPDDAMAKAIKDAYAKETGDKRNMARVLATVYKKLADEPFKETTVGQVFQSFLKARQTAIGDTLPWVRAAIGSQLDKVLPTEMDAPMNAMTQEAIRREFRRAAAVLEVLP